MKISCKIQIILISLFMISGCSSLERAHYFKVSETDHLNQPDISYTPESILHHGYRKHIALTYKRKNRFWWKDDVQQVVISANYFLNQLSWGPPFLPVIPLLGSVSKINKNERLELSIRYGATGPFYDKMDKPELPVLLIITKSKGVIRPIKVDRYESGLRLTYDTTIGETPEFLIRENIVKLGKESLRIPGLKFVFDSSLNYQWMVPIGG
jgi:hypothetical protein